MLNHNLGHTRLIRETCEAHGLTIPQTAYVLATAHWETSYADESCYVSGGNQRSQF